MRMAEEIGDELRQAFRSLHCGGELTDPGPPRPAGTGALRVPQSTGPSTATVLFHSRLPMPQAATSAARTGRAWAM